MTTRVFFKISIVLLAFFSGAAKSFKVLNKPVNEVISQILVPWTSWDYCIRKVLSIERPHPLLWFERRKLDAKFPLNKCVLIYHHLLSLGNERLFFQVILQHWEDFCSFDSLWLFPSVVIGSSCIYVKLLLACAWLPKLILFRSSLNRTKNTSQPPAYGLKYDLLHPISCCWEMPNWNFYRSQIFHFPLSGYRSWFRLYRVTIIKKRLKRM